MEDKDYYETLYSIYDLKEYTNKKKPTLYDEIRLLENTDLHNRLIFEFSVRNKQNQIFVQKIFDYYDSNKQIIEEFCSNIEKNYICWITFKFNLDTPYGQILNQQSTIFYKLVEYLENIEFLPFNFYYDDNVYRHPMINPILFIIINKIYETKNIIAKMTNEIQLDKIIDKNTIEYTGEKGFKLRLEKTQLHNFTIENHYLNDSSSYFYHKSEMYPSINSPTLNPKFITKNISFKLNLGQNEADLKMIIETLYKNIEEIKEANQKAIKKYTHSIKSKKEENIEKFLKKFDTNSFYSKLLYIYDQDKLFSKEKIDSNFENLDKKIQAKLHKENSNEKTLHQKHVFYRTLIRKTSLSIEKNTLETELSKLKRIIDNKLYLQLT